MQISQRGIDFIKQAEGFSSHVYNDAGHSAIGYGHDLTANESYPDGIGETVAKDLLEADCQCPDSRDVTSLMQDPLQSGHIVPNTSSVISSPCWQEPIHGERLPKHRPLFPQHDDMLGTFLQPNCGRDQHLTRA